MPDATGLEQIAATIRSTVASDSVISADFFRQQATVTVIPETIVSVLRCLSKSGYQFLVSVHGVDYYPQEPRFAVHYQLLDMEKCDRIGVRICLETDNPTVPSVTPDWPTANHQEREIYDMFGVVFDNHPDLRRILMPEDYEGHPQRRDFPIGGEPVLFTGSEQQTPRWYE